jgi:hypothetical protein
MHVLVEFFMAQNTPIDTLFRYHDSGLRVYQRGPHAHHRSKYTRPRQPFPTPRPRAVWVSKCGTQGYQRHRLYPPQSLLEPGHRQRGRVSRARRCRVRSICCAMLQSGRKSAGSLGISWMTFLCNAATYGASERDESGVAETTGRTFKVFL